MDIQGDRVDVKQICCGEVEGLGTGAVVWDSAILLAKYLEKNSESYSPSLILELGSGNGWLGIACGLVFPYANVVLTDQVQLLPLIHENVILNEHNFPEKLPKGRLSVEELNWGSTSNELVQELMEPFEGEDVILLLSDCVYEQCPVNLLIYSMRYICACNPKTKIIMSMEQRPHKAQEYFFKHITSYFNLRKLPASDHDASYTARDIDIWYMTLL